MRRMTIALCLTLCFNASAPAAERSVIDNQGRQLTLPANPQRIVVMHEPLLGIPLMDLGIPFVGAYGRRQDGRFVTAVDFIDSVFGPGRSKPAGFGAMGQIDLERLRALKPDLIIGTELDVRRLPQLSRVAPVYIQHVGQQHMHGFGVEAELAKALGHENAFANRHALYRQKLARVRRGLDMADAAQPSVVPTNTPSPDSPARMPSSKEIHDAGSQNTRTATSADTGPTPRQPTYLAILLTDQINVVGNMSGAIQALEDLGYQRLPLTDKADNSQLGSTLMVPLSAERFGRLEPDLLVVMNNYTATAKPGLAAQAEVARATLDRILPGWQRFLKPARENRVLYLDSRQVTTPSVQSALHTLEAVESWQKQRATSAP